jgi:uncharacterized membrane protein
MNEKQETVLRGKGDVLEKSTLMAALAYLGILIVIPFLTEDYKDPFVKFHIKQGVVLIVFGIIGFFVSVIPVLGWLIGWLFWLAALILLVIGVMNAVSGNEKELPVIGHFAKKLNF